MSALLQHLSRLAPTALPAGATLVAEGAAAGPLFARALAARPDAAAAFLVASRHRFDGKEDLEFLEDAFSLPGRHPAPSNEVLES